MAGKIRGITIELSADAAGVLKAVSEINSKIKVTNTELKDVDRLLKLNPTNMTLIGQKTQYLQQQIGNTKTKLDELKQAQQDMDANGVDKNSEQYQALQREIIATEQELKKLMDTAGSGSAALAKVSAVTGEIGDKMESAGKAVMPISTAIGTGLALSAKTAIDFESAFAGVKKTVNGTDEQLEDIRQGIIDLSKNTSSSAVDIAAVAEAAGQLGIQTENILDFTETMVMLGDTTNLSAEEAASALAKFSNITGTSADDYSRMGSVIVDLGNNFATTEADIVDMATNLASAGTLVGLTEPQIFALATAMSSVGIEAAAGGTAMTQTLTAIEKAVVNSGDELTKIANIAGMSAEDFTSAWENDPIVAIESFISGLGKLDEKGESATLVLDELGMSGVKQSNMLKSLGLASETLSGAIGTASNAWSENTALQDEAAQKYSTTESKIAQLKATLTEVGIQIGDIILPVIKKIIDGAKEGIKWFTELDDGTKETIVTIGLVVAAIGPLLVIGGKVMKGISSITGALSKMGGTSFGPIGLVVAGVAALYTGVSSLVSGWESAYNEASPFTEALENIRKANDDLSASLDSTKSNYESQVAASEANAAAADGLYQHLLNLIAGYDGTDAAQLAIQGTIDQLNQLIPGLALEWDSVTNSLNLTTDEVYANIEAMRAQAEVAALQEMYTDSLKEQYYAEKNLTDARKTLIGVLAEHNVTAEEAIALARDENVTTGEAIAFLTEHGVAVQDATGYYNQLMGALGEYFEASGNAQEATENVTFAENELSNAMVTAAEATSTNKDTVLNAVDEINAGVDFTPAETEAAEAGQNIPQDMADGINANSGTVGAAADNLAAEVTSGLSTLPADTTTAGSEAGSGLETGFGSWTGTVSGTVDEMYEFFNSTLGTTLPAMMSTWGSNSGQKFNNGIKLWMTDVQTTAGNMKTYIQNALASLPAYLRNIGSQAGSGLYYGLASWQASLTSLASSIANSINASARRALQIKSPSKKMQEVGEYTGEGLQIGLERSAPGILGAMGGIANQMASMAPNLGVGISAYNAAVNNMNRGTTAMAADMSGIGTIMTLLAKYLPQAAADRDIYFNDGTWAGKLAPAINNELGRMAAMAAR